MAQSVGFLTLAQVMISWFVGSGPVLDSVLTTQSLEPPLDSVSPSFSDSCLLAPCLSVFQKMNKCQKIKKIYKKYLLL